MENASADLFSSIEGMPAEAKVLETESLQQLACCAPYGVREYELGRRFETGVGGLRQDTQCALFFYGESGILSVTLRQHNAYGPDDVTYLGFPPGRRAVRRLRKAGHVLAVADYAKASERCENLRDRAAAGEFR